jgi:hypothetical protein
VLIHGVHVPSKLVFSLDPEMDRGLLARHEFPASKEPVAYVCIERACVGQVTDPEALPEVMRTAERQRESAPGAGGAR